VPCAKAGMLRANRMAVAVRVRCMGVWVLG
jgi:hypothetical protein